MLKVFGHLNPDTDSTCSAIAYSWFLTEHMGKEATPYLLGNPNKEAVYVLQRFNISTPKILTKLENGEEVVIVDTNNPAELLSDIGEARIQEIVDHHKLSGLSTSEPLAMTMRPVACTATIIWQIMQYNGISSLPKDIAGLMLSAILSDTLKFTSPTTTEEDKKAVEELSKLAEVEIDELASAMFAAKSDLSGMQPRDILLSDSKVFTMGTRKVRISSLETTNPEKALVIEADLLKAIEELKQEEQTDALFFFIVDIFSSSSTLLLASDTEKEIATQAFKGEVNTNQMVLPGVVSRKKQMVPPLESVLN